MATLAELVQDLPAELYNNILEYTLTTDEDEVTIDKSEYFGISRNVKVANRLADYQPPKQLQINRATRTAVMKMYYSSTRFLWPQAVRLVWHQSWLDSLTPFALGTISTIRVETSNTPDLIRGRLTGKFYTVVKRWMIRHCGKAVFAGLLDRLEHVIYFRVVREDRINLLSLEEMRREAGALDFDKT